MTPGRKDTGSAIPGRGPDIMTRLLHILTYAFYAGHMAWATWGIMRLYDHIGSAFGSAAPFYFVWTLTPVVVAHFGLRKWGSHARSGWVMVATSAVIFLTTMSLVKGQLATDHIGPMAMLMYVPFPLTEVLIVALGLVMARQMAVSGKSGSN